MMLRDFVGFSNAGRAAWSLVAALMFLGSAAQTSHADALRSEAVKSEGQSLTWSFSLDGAPSLTSTRRGDNLKLDGFAYGGLPGEPMLPVRRVMLLLPEDAVKKSVQVTLENEVWEDLKGTFDLAPGKPASTHVDGKMVLSWGRGKTAPASGGRYASVYEADAFTPASPIVRASMQKYRQWCLAVVQIVPVAVNPVRKTARILRSATVRVTYKQDASLKTKKTPALRERFWQKIESRVLNPQHRAQFYDYSKRTGRAWEEASTYLVVMPYELYYANRASVESFLSYKRTAGHRGATVRLLVGGPDSGGATDALSRALGLRSDLQREYLEWGFDSVLIIGNPHPIAFTRASSAPMLYCNADGYTNDPMFWTPTDMAFAELSEDWNTDEDLIWGEYGYDVSDQICELSVGRLPYYGQQADLQRILRKFIDHQSGIGDTDYRKKSIIAAAISNHAPQEGAGGVIENPSDKTFGDDWVRAMAGLVDESAYAPHMIWERRGYYNDGRAYPPAVPSSALSRGNMINQWSSGAGFVGWFGHGSSAGVYRRVWDWDINLDDITQHPGETDAQLTPDEQPFFLNTDTQYLDDSRPSIVVQVSCENGTPENPANLGYSLLLRGAVATVSSSRVSWYRMGPWYPDMQENGDNGSFSYGIYGGLSSGLSVGEALNETRADMGMWFAEAAWMNMLGFNIYGDPDAALAPFPHLVPARQKLNIISDGNFFAGVWDYELGVFTATVTDSLNGEIQFDLSREKWLSVVLYDLPSTTETLASRAAHLFIP